MGLYLVDPSGGGDVGAAFTWRRAGRTLDVGLRGQLVDADGRLGLAGGFELGGGLYRASPEFPLDVAWTAGAGVGAVPDLDVAVLRVPLGVSAGRRLAVGDVGLVPYVAPRLLVDVRFRGDAPARAGGFGGGDHTALRFDLDLGVDLELRRRWGLRVGGTVGYDDAVGVGILFPGF